VFVHAAAVPTHRADPRALAWVNVAGTENALNGARRARCKRFVLVSCADVTLVNEDRVNWNEDRDLMGLPLDAHARSKRLAEEIALSASSADIEVVAIRPAWIWGPGDTTQLPELIREANEHGAVRLVGSGENLVATTYIDNLVDAIIAAAEAPAAKGGIYYVADNEMNDASEVLGGMSAAAGLPPPKPGVAYALAYAMALVRARTGGKGLTPTDVVKRGRSTTFDVQNAVKDLGWEPKVSMKDGLDALAKWIADEGGATAVASMARPPADASSVDAQVEDAGGD
jgi:nucleoside-diphosphate-sugar epimerase